MTPHESTPEDLLSVGRQAAEAGARELMGWRGRFVTREKSPADLVTDADLASQEAIQRVILAAHPDHAFVGEERPDTLAALAGDGYAWIVDPLDGTTNYVHRYPHFAVSVAVARRGELLAGVVYDPVAEECFTAARGAGAQLNGRPMQTSDVATVADALVAVSLPPRVEPDAPDLLDFVRVIQVSQAVRRSGSAALNLAYVAAGRLDAFWATHIHAWDVAAGVLMVQEAGGRVTGRDGREFELREPHFVSAATASLHRDLFRVLAERQA